MKGSFLCPVSILFKTLELPLFSFNCSTTVVLKKCHEVLDVFPPRFWALDFQYEFIASLITASAWPRLGALTAIMNSSVVLSSFIFLFGSKWFSKTDTRDSSTDSQDILTQHTLIACITISISTKRPLSGWKNSFRISFGSISHSCSIEYCRVDFSNHFKNSLYCFFKLSSDATLRDRTGTARTAFTNTGP